MIKSLILPNSKSGNLLLENAANRYINSSGFTRAKSALANEVKNRIVNDIKKAVK